MPCVQRIHRQRINTLVKVLAFVLLASPLTSGCKSSDDSPEDADSNTAGDAGELDDAGTAPDSSLEGTGGEVTDSSAPDPDATTATGTYCVPDESGAVPSREAYNSWIKVEVPGTKCSDGSQYKFFVNYSESSNNLAILLEPGGACWDYESCYGSARGAANRNGIPDDHMDIYAHLYPYAGGLFGSTGAASQWNKVFLPYCTGDVYAGTQAVDYVNPATDEAQTFHHVGNLNTQQVAAWLADTFQDIPRLLVSGCSAGGAGALLTYGIFRENLAGAQCGYMINDSGPLFTSTGRSAPLHAQTFNTWGGSGTFDLIASYYGDAARSRVDMDVSELNTILAEAYPMDRLATVAYQKDLNYSLYSYESFYDYPPYQTVLDYWTQDLQSLRDQHDAYDNLAYYMPYFRVDNCSHCMSIVPLDHLEALLTGYPVWSGTEIEEAGLDYSDFVALVLDDSQPLQNYFETSQADGDFTAEQIAACQSLD